MKLGRYERAELARLAPADATCKHCRQPRTAHATLVFWCPHIAAATVGRLRPIFEDSGERVSQPVEVRHETLANPEPAPIAPSSADAVPANGTLPL